MLQFYSHYLVKKSNILFARFKSVTTFVTYLSTFYSKEGSVPNAKKKYILNSRKKMYG